MTENFLVLLKSKVSFFTPTEKKIATFILSHPQETVSLSLAEFSQAAEVSQGSVINFCQKYAQGGFPKLKMQVALSHQKADALSLEDTATGVLERTAALNKQAYDLVCATNGEEVLSRAVQLILSARKVEIYGVFRSGAVAMDFCYQLLGLGIPASSFTDILTCAVSSLLLHETDLAVVISSSGRTKEMLDVVKNAKSQGAHVLALTEDINSPLATIADHVLVAPSVNSGTCEMLYSETRTAQLLLTDAISNIIRVHYTEKEQEKYNAIKAVLNSHSVKEGYYE